jgi:hypothetical protein
VKRQRPSPPVGRPFAFYRWFSAFALKRRARAVRPAWLALRLCPPFALLLEAMRLWQAFALTPLYTPCRLLRLTLSRRCVSVTGMRFNSAAVPATVSGECGVRSPFQGAATGGLCDPREGEHSMRRSVSQETDRGVSLYAGFRGWPGAENTFVVSDIVGLWGGQPPPLGRHVADDGRNP